MTRRKISGPQGNWVTTSYGGPREDGLSSDGGVQEGLTPGGAPGGCQMLTPFGGVG